MTLTINGKAQQLPEGCTIGGLLQSLAIVAERVAVEVNGDLVRRARHVEYLLRDGDRVEIVTFVGGG